VPLERPSSSTSRDSGEVLGRISATFAPHERQRCSGSEAFVAVVEAADFGQLDDLAHARTPGPEPAESPAVPPHDGLGLHENHGLAPTRPDPRERDPEEAVRMNQVRARVAALEDRQLLTKGKVFKDEIATNAESGAKVAEEAQEDGSH